jgi:hypothetical protein
LPHQPNLPRCHLFHTDWESPLPDLPIDAFCLLQWSMSGPSGVHPPHRGQMEGNFCAADFRENGVRHQILGQLHSVADRCRTT